MLQQVRRHQQQQGHAERADDAGQLGSGARGLGHRRARRTAADRKALEESGGQVGGAEADHLLVGIDIGARSRRIGARQHAGVGERHQGDGEPADQDGTDVGVGDPGDGEGRQALRQRAEHRHARARGQIQRAHDDGRADHRDQDAGHALAALQQQDHRQGACADRERRPVGSAAQHRRGDGPQASQRPVALDREPEELGQLADQHRQRNAVHVAVADRLGQQFGDEAQTRQAGQDAHRPGDDRHHAGQRDGAHRVAAGQRQDDGEDDGRQRRVGSQHQDAAGAEQRIGQQRHDRRVEAVDARHARCHRIGDADGHQHRRQHQPGHDVVPQPGRLVAAQGLQARQPAHPPRLVRRSAAGRAMRPRSRLGCEGAGSVMRLRQRVGRRTTLPRCLTSNLPGARPSLDYGRLAQLASGRPETSRAELLYCSSPSFFLSPCLPVAGLRS